MKAARNETMKIDRVVPAVGEIPAFRPGQRVKVATRSPVGHYRVPTYMRGKTAVIETVMKPRTVNNEEEAFGRNAGSLRHSYRIALAMTAIWENYTGSSRDSLRIEVFETWLEGAAE